MNDGFTVTQRSDVSSMVNANPPMQLDYRNADLESKTMTLEQELKEFRATQRVETLAIGTSTWTWLDSHGSGPPILLLHGGLGDGESFFQLISPLAMHFRVLSVSIPASLSSVRATINDLTALLDHLQIDKISLYGHSQGGYLAQRMLSDKPSRVANLALSGTCLPSEDHARTLERQLRIVRLLPDTLLRLAAAAQFRRILRRDASELGNEERRFWLRYFVEGLKIDGLRSRVVSSARLQLDYHRGPVPSLPDPQTWSGQVLLVTFGHDSIIGMDDAARLSEHYPSARHVAFLEQGHLGPIVKPKALAESLETLIPEYSGGT
jgi:pimeloyl-ACP methyl ester carboxylesterase